MIRWLANRNGLYAKTVPLMGKAHFFSLDDLKAVKEVSQFSAHSEGDVWSWVPNLRQVLVGNTILGLFHWVRTLNMCQCKAAFIHICSVCRAGLNCLAWSLLLDMRLILRDGDWKWTTGLWRAQILDDTLQPALVVHKGWRKKIFIRKRREGGGKQGERERWRNGGRAMRPSGLVNKDWVFLWSFSLY